MTEPFEDPELGVRYECDSCDLSFYVVANNDRWIQGGHPIVVYCPRCGERLEEE